MSSHEKRTLQLLRGTKPNTSRFFRFFTLHVLSGMDAKRFRASLKMCRQELCPFIAGHVRVRHEVGSSALLFVVLYFHWDIQEQ